MKVFLSFLFFCATLLTSNGQGIEYYSGRYDNIDINNIFKSRLLNHYVDCLLDKKPCPPEGKDLKRVLPDALKTRCGSCTKIQKAKSLDVVTRLYYQHPALYTALAERYDPTGEYTRNFENWFDQQNNVKNSQKYDGNQYAARTTAQSTTRSVQQETRRSPSISNARRNPNDVPSERTRIPSTWITSTTVTTTRRPTTSRAPLRTLPVTARTTQQQEPAPLVFREIATAFRAPVTQPSTARPSPVTFRETPAPTRPVFIEPVVRFQEQEEVIKLPDEIQAPQIFREPSTTFRVPLEPATRRTQPIIFTEPVTQAPVVFREVTTLRPPTVRTTTTDLPIIIREQVPEVAVIREPVKQTAFVQPPPTVFRPPPQPVTNPSVVFQQEQSPESVRIQPANNRQQQQPTQRNEPVLRDSNDVRRAQARAPNFQSPVRTNFQPDVIDNFFVPNGNGPFRRSIDRLLDRTGKVITNVAGMLRSTIGVITGTR